MMRDDIDRVLLTEEDLKKRVEELGAQISKDYADSEDFVMVSVLKGSVIFMSDLMRAIDIPASIDFMVCSSYGAGTVSSGAVKIVKDLDIPLHNKDILIVEDILDSGRTLSFLSRLLNERGAKSIKICTLLDKPARREADVHADYAGFDIPDEFVVGYGLDFNEKYRNLPFIGVLKPHVYS